MHTRSRVTRPAPVQRAAQAPTAAPVGEEEELEDAEVQLDRATRHGVHFERVGVRSRETDPRAPVPAPSGGRPLPESLRQSLEPVFGEDFSDVRVHESAHPTALGAKAFTRGGHIHLEPGRYEPGSSRGRSLLAHELTHVVQQRRGRVSLPGGGGAPINADPRLEAEAEQMESRVLRGASPQVAPAGPPPDVVPRGAPGPAAPVQLAKHGVGDELEFEHLGQTGKGQVVHVENDGGEKEEDSIYHVQHEGGTHRVQNGKLLHLAPGTDSADWWKLDSPPGTPTHEPLSPLLTHLEELDNVKELEDQSGHGHSVFQQHMFAQPGFKPELRSLVEAQISGGKPPITNRATQQAFFERSLLVSPHAKDSRRLQITPTSEISYGKEYVKNRGGSQRHVPPTLNHAHVEFDFGPPRKQEKPSDYPEPEIDEEMQEKLDELDEGPEKEKAQKEARKEAKKASKRKVEQLYKDTGRYPNFDGSYPGLTTYTHDRNDDFGLDEETASSLIDAQGSAFDDIASEERERMKEEGHDEKESGRLLTNYERVGTLLEDEYARRPGAMFAQKVARDQGSLDALLNPRDEAAIMTDKNSATTVAENVPESEQKRFKRQKSVVTSLVESVKNDDPESEKYRRTVNQMARFYAKKDDPARRKALQERLAREERSFRKSLNGGKGLTFSASPVTTTPTGGTVTDAMIQTPWISQNPIVPRGSFAASIPQTTKAHELYSKSETDWQALPLDFQSRSQSFLDTLHGSGAVTATPRAVGTIKDGTERQRHLQDRHTNGGGIQWDDLKVIPGMGEKAIASLQSTFASPMDILNHDKKALMKMKLPGVGEAKIDALLRELGAIT